MKRLFSLMLIGLLLGVVYAQNSEVPFYKEEFRFEIKVLENGDAQITMKTSWLEPKDEIKKEISRILNQTNLTKEEAIKKYEETQLDRYIASLVNFGIKTSNQTLKLLGVDKEGNLTIVFSAYAEGFAKYYSYDGYWEIIVDPTRGYASAKIPDTGLPYKTELHNYFVIELPSDAELIEYPKPISREFNQSKFYVRSEVKGNKIIITSDIILEPYLSPEGFKALFGEYEGFYIRYTSSSVGEETYQKVKNEQYLKAEVFENGTTRLFVQDKYIEPKERVELIKTQIKSLGVENVTNLILQNNVRGLASKFVTVQSANVEIKGIDEEGPLVIESRYLLQNFTKFINGTYEYSFDPTLGYSFYNLGYRSQNEINQTLKMEFVLPKSATIVEVPKNISREIKGNKFTVVTKVNGNTISVTANIFIRYGAHQEDVKALFEGIEKAYIKYTLPEQKATQLDYKQMAAVAGALILIGLALFLIKRR